MEQFVIRLILASGIEPYLLHSMPGNGCHSPQAVIEEFLTIQRFAQSFFMDLRRELWPKFVLMCKLF